MSYLVTKIVDIIGGRLYVCNTFSFVMLRLDD
jgi:hypothetical protein